MTLLLAGIIVAIGVLVSLSAAMLLQEARIRDLDARVGRVLWGQVRSAPLVGLQGWLQQLGEMSRCFYSPSSLDNMRVVVASSGFNPHRTMPMLLGCKMALLVGLPVLAAEPARCPGQSWTV